MGLIHSWRWYGPDDPVNLQDIRQAGATNVVSALHHIETGAVWTASEILKRKQEIENHGLTWSVVESVNVHDAIKLGSDQRNLYIDNYLQTLTNLAACEIYTVCYNFMPVLDWTRTNLKFITKTNSLALRFELVAIAAFDRFILKRANAEEDYDPKIWAQGNTYWQQLNHKQKQELQTTILAGVPGTNEVLTIKYFIDKLSEYQNINTDQLKLNYKYFIQQISPEAARLDVKLGIHPDDPPMPLFGLPRIVSSLEDLDFILECSDVPNHGLTLCTGSLGPSCGAHIPQLIQKWGHRIHFLHLRNVNLQNDGAFYEADHLDGAVDMYEVMKALITEMRRRKQLGQSDWAIPMRPDHGHQMLHDLKRDSVFPGYSAIGRLKGLAELRGLELGISRSLNI